MHRTIAFTAAALLASAAIGQTVRLDYSPYSSGSGGEFTATPITGFAGLTGLPADLSTSTFQTFCMEVNEHFRPGDTYDFVINTGAVMGGISGQTSPGFDPLDEMTAYLYHNFRFMTLPLFDYGAGRTASAADLQNAIWYIEGEGGANNYFVALAAAAVSGGSWSGIGDVRVLNISNTEFNPGQDQLTIVPEGFEPAPGATALGLIGMLAAGRRKR